MKEWGLEALRFASTTLELGLEFHEDAGPSFGSRHQLTVPRERYLEVYAPSGERSTQSTLGEEP